jgi:hypothetical protein
MVLGFVQANRLLLTDGATAGSPPFLTRIGDHCHQHSSRLLRSLFTADLQAFIPWRSRFLQIMTVLRGSICRSYHDRVQHPL